MTISGSDKLISAIRNKKMLVTKIIIVHWCTNTLMIVPYISLFMDKIVCTRWPHCTSKIQQDIDEQKSKVGCLNLVL